MPTSCTCLTVRSLLRHALFFAAGVVWVGAAACDATPKSVEVAKQGGPAVDEKALASAVEALALVDTDMRHVFAASALREVETKRLSENLLGGLEVLTQAPPDQRSLLLSKVFTEQISLANEVCAGSAREIFVESAQAAVAQRRSIVLDGCKFESRKLLTRAQIDVADPMAVWLAHMMHAELSAHGELAAGEIELLTLLGTTPLQ